MKGCAIFEEGVGMTSKSSVSIKESRRWQGVCPTIRDNSHFVLCNRRYNVKTPRGEEKEGRGEKRKEGR